MLYEVLLGIDRAAHDTGKRITMQVRESDPLKAAIQRMKAAASRPAGGLLVIKMD